MTMRNSGRRAFLRGLGGLTLGLPFLEYTHEKAWAATTGHAKRLVVVFNHGGETMCMEKSGLRAGNPKIPSYDPAMPKIDHWLPKPGGKFGIAHELFEGTDLESKLMVIRGIDNAAALKGRYGGDHGLSNCTSRVARATGRQRGQRFAGVFARWNGILRRSRCRRTAHRVQAARARHRNRVLAATRQCGKRPAGHLHIGRWRRGVPHCIPHPVWQLARHLAHRGGSSATPRSSRQSHAR